VTGLSHESIRGRRAGSAATPAGCNRIDTERQSTTSHAGSCAEHPGHEFVKHTVPGPAGLPCEVDGRGCGKFLPYRTIYEICGTPLPPHDPLGVCSPESLTKSDRLGTVRFFGVKNLRRIRRFERNARLRRLLEDEGQPHDLNWVSDLSGPWGRSTAPARPGVPPSSATESGPRRPRRSRRSENGVR
jgi:hypothetical protein